MGAGKRASRERERWRKEGMDGMEWRGLNGEQKGGGDNATMRLYGCGRQTGNQRLRRSWAGLWRAHHVVGRET